MSINFNEIIGSASAASDRFSSSSDNDNVQSCSECGCINEPLFEFGDKLFCSDCLDRVTFVCACCGERFYTEDARETEDGDVCDSCLVDEYGRCDACDTWMKQRYLSWCEDTDEYVCSSCLDMPSWRNAYYRCDCCDDVHHEHYCQSTEVYYNANCSETWCEGCVERGDVFVCQDCDRHFDGSYVEAEEDAWGDCTCEYCLEIRRPREQDVGSIRTWVAPHGMRTYGYKPLPCFKLSDMEIEEGHDHSDTICYGVELEVEDHRNSGRNIDTDADWVNSKLGFTYVKSDSSLSHGMEIVSHPLSFKAWMEQKEKLAEVFRELIGLGYNSHDNGNCGLHVHISLKPLLEKNPQATCAMLVLMERFWTKIVRFTRRTASQLDQWAQLYSTRDTRYEDLAKMSKAERSRYMAVNLQNDHTVELRVFRGTLKLETFIATLQFCKRFVDVCTSSTLDDLNCITWEELIGDEYEELTAYCKKRFDPEPVTFEDHTVFEDTAQEEAPAPVPEHQPFPGNWPSLEEMHAANEAGAFIFGERPEGSFHDGDWVRLARDGEGYTREIRVGWIGHICYNASDEGDDMIGVDFGVGFPGSHDCNGHCAYEHGQYIPVDCLELL